MAGLNLGGKSILLTGACGALGRAIASTLAENGATVIANDIVPPDELPDTPAFDSERYIRSGCASAKEAAELVEAARARAGQLPDIVCLHAGIVKSEPIDEFNAAAFDAIIETNVRTSFLLAQAASAAWKRAGQRGSLIFTGSWVATVPWPGIAPYSASKAAITQLARSFARELAPHGIRANVIAPGIVAAGMAKKQWDTEPDYRSRATKAIPLGHMQDPQSVANAFLFMCSDLSDYMTGSVLLIDGGCSLYPMD